MDSRILVARLDLIGARLALIEARLAMMSGGPDDRRVDAIDEAIGTVEERDLIDLSDAELDRLADVADDAYERGLRDDELVAVLTAATDQLVAARGS